MELRDEVKEKIERLASEFELFESSKVFASILLKTVEVIELQKEDELEQAFQDILNEVFEESRTLKKIKKFLELSEIIMIIYESEADWSDKFDQIFAINKEICKIDMSFDWYDPDSTYEEDVSSYVEALKEKVKNYELNNLNT